MDQNEIEIKVQNATFDFVKGFITGQVVLMILIFFLLKIFLFRGEQETKLDLSRPRKKFISKKSSSALSLQHSQRQHTLNSLILHKLKYDLPTRPWETCAWLNVLAAQVIAHLRAQTHLTKQLLDWLDEGLLNDTQKRPTFLGPVSINELSFGEEYPELRNARVKLGDPTDSAAGEEEERMKILVDFVFDDQITFAVDTQVLINWPQPHIASLPVTLSVSLVKFAGTIAIEFMPEDLARQHQNQDDAKIPSSTAKELDAALAVYILPDFTLDFSIGSLLGHRTKVKDLPKISSLITGALRSLFIKELVYPAKKLIKIPTSIK